MDKKEHLFNRWDTESPILLQHPDGRKILKDGTIFHPDGTIVHPNGVTVKQKKYASPLPHSIRFISSPESHPEKIHGLNHFHVIILSKLSHQALFRLYRRGSISLQTYKFLLNKLKTRKLSSGTSKGKHTTKVLLHKKMLTNRSRQMH